MSASTVEVSLEAIAHNARELLAAAGGAALCAVVKADGYGHGSVPVARAALEAGATWLAVAQVDEAAVIRVAGIEAPMLLLSEADPADIDRALALGLSLTLYRAEMIDAVAARADALGVPSVSIHLKVDTGMNRVGCEPSDAVALAQRIGDASRLRLEGTMTHLALADEPDDATTTDQLDVFDEVLARLTAAGIDPGIRHAANSAGTIAHERSHYDLVRDGIALYGIHPAPGLAGCAGLRPALTWTTQVRFVKGVLAGEKVSYGHRHTFGHDTVVATLPVGYADGVVRRLGLTGGEVLVGGRRCRIVGVVTMDQLVVDCGPGADVRVGDPAVLIGRQGDEEVTAEEWADRLDTIGYEIVCGIGPRVERRHR